MTILPTHQCFDDVLDHQLVILPTQDPAAAARQFIVHGICLMPNDPSAIAADSHLAEPGAPFAHAWVEDDLSERVCEAGLLDGRKVWYTVARAEWYTALRVQHRTRYTPEQARILNWQHGHDGPWVPAYRALCRRRRLPASR